MSHNIRKPGDWNCPKCNFLLFASKRMCAVCKIYKTDWKCSGCASYNKKANAKCFRCDQLKPAEVNAGQITTTTTTTTVTKEGEAADIAATRPLPPLPTAETLEQKDECSICLASKKDAFLYPCGHNYLCRKCAKELEERKGKCPLCRAEIVKTFPLYQ